MKLGNRFFPSQAAYNNSNTLKVNSTLNNYRTNVHGMACRLSGLQTMELSSNRVD